MSRVCLSLVFCFWVVGELGWFHRLHGLQRTDGLVPCAFHSKLSTASWIKACLVIALHVVVPTFMHCLQTSHHHSCVAYEAQLDGPRFSGSIRTGRVYIYTHVSKQDTCTCTRIVMLSSSMLTCLLGTKGLGLGCRGFS